MKALNAFVILIQSLNVFVFLARVILILKGRTRKFCSYKQASESNRYLEGKMCLPKTYLGVIEGKASCSSQEEEGTAEREIKHTASLFNFKEFPRECGG